jgi:nucleoside-triphosphatase THEP1
MIKDDKRKCGIVLSMENAKNFLPSFGNKPKEVVGREAMISEFINSLSLPIGYPDKTTVFVGQRGMGKTALLLEIADRAKKAGYVTVRVSAGDTMLEEILELIQIEGMKYFRKGNKSIKGVNATMLGFSLGVEFGEKMKTGLSFRNRMTVLLEELRKRKKEVLILIDEVQPASKTMREFALTYQHLIGDEINISVALAGLPQFISSVLNDKVLTFLNRAKKIELNMLNISDVRRYYAETFDSLNKKVDVQTLGFLAKSTLGYPYLLQLVGFNVLSFLGSKKVITREIAKVSVEESKKNLIDSVYKPCLHPLSEKDNLFLKQVALLGKPAKIADLTKRLKKTNSYVQQYKARLVESGVIASSRRGEVEIIVPYLGEYLIGNDKT